MGASDWDRVRRTVTLVFQELGLSTRKLGLMEPGQRLANLASPLGKPADVGRFGTVVVVSGYFGAETRVSLMPIMIDGTGMFGASRVNVGGETKLACVEGPEFDGREVDWN